MGYAPGCMVGAVSPVGLPSGTGPSSMGLGAMMGLSAGFYLLGHFCGPILLAWVVYPGHWVVAVGRWEVLWAFLWAVGHTDSCVCEGG